MKNAITHALVLCLLLCAACVTAPPQNPLSTDEDYYNRGIYFMNNRNFYESIPILEQLREKFPLSPFAVLAELRLGDSHYMKKEYIEAENYFENFRRLHPSHPEVPYSIFMTGMCQFQQILIPERDQTSAKEVVEHLQLLVDLYPDSPYTGTALCKIAEAKQRIAAHDFFVGKFYLKKQSYAGAIERFDKLLKQYPNSIAKDKVLLAMGKATILDGQTTKGKRILQLLLKLYPDGANASEARSLLARN